MPFKTSFCRSDQAPQIHGGIIASFIDIAGDYAAACALGHGVPTVNLRIDFLRLATGSDLEATATVVKAGRTLSVVDVCVRDGDGRLIAIGRGDYFTAPPNSATENS